MFPWTDVLILLLVTICTDSWHLYDFDDKARGNISSTNCLRSRKKYSQNSIEKFHLWPNLFEFRNLKSSEVAYGYYEAIEEIWKNQHPRDCSKAKFIISNGWPWGFGSVVHVESTILSLALELGRVYLPHPEGSIFNTRHDPDNRWQMNTSFCRNQSKLNYDCYYESWSSCTIYDAIGNKSFSSLSNLIILDTLFESDSYFNLSKTEKIKNISKMKTFIIRHTGQSKISKFIPLKVKSIILCAPIPLKHSYYWWRAVTASYFLRPHKRTVSYLDKLQYYTNDKKGLLLSKGLCIAMYIRHGDKHIEMELLPFQKYADAAELIWSRILKDMKDKKNYNYDINVSVGRGNGTEYAKPVSSKPTVFIGTEDPNVLLEAQKWGNKKGWRILYTTLFDRNASISRLTDEEIRQYKERNILPPRHDLEYISMLLNLQFALKCDAWVCTLASNWCRLIDELRATVGGKANRYYADLSKETCSTPPVSVITRSFHLTGGANK